MTADAPAARTAFHTPGSRDPVGPTAHRSAAANVRLRPRLLQAGDTDADIRRRRQTGEWSALRPGVYLPNHAPTTRVQRYLAVIDSQAPTLSSGSVISHVSAAALWGLPLWGINLDRIHVTREMTSGACRTAGVHVHATRKEITALYAGGIAVTNAARTVIDTARMVPFEQGVVVADAALREELVTLDELLQELNRVVGCAGAKRARAVVAFADHRAESVGESRSRVLMRRAGLADPQLQVAIADAAGNTVARTDFGYPELRVVGEFDGRIKYGRLLRPGQSPGDAVFQEKLREDAIRDLGWIVIRWIWAELNRPDVIVRRWRQAFDRAGRWMRA